MVTKTLIDGIPRFSSIFGNRSRVSRTCSRQKEVKRNFRVRAFRRGARGRNREKEKEGGREEQCTREIPATSRVPEELLLGGHEETRYAFASNRIIEPHCSDAK